MNGERGKTEATTNLPYKDGAIMPHFLSEDGRRKRENRRGKERAKKKREREKRVRLRGGRGKEAMMERQRDVLGLGQMREAAGRR